MPIVNDYTQLYKDSLDVDSIYVDFSEKFDSEDYDCYVAEPTFSDVQEHYSFLNDYKIDYAQENDIEFDSPDDIKDEDLDEDECIEAFKDSDAYWEYADAYRAIIYNYVNPIKIDSYNADSYAENLKEHAPNVTLVRFYNQICDEEAREEGEDVEYYEYALCLTACGMDLSDEIARAYICCGEVPPARIMDRAIRNTNFDDILEDTESAKIKQHMLNIVYHADDLAKHNQKAAEEYHYISQSNYAEKAFSKMKNKLEHDEIMSSVSVDKGKPNQRTKISL